MYKTDRSRLSNHAIVFNILFDLLSLERKRIDFGANKPKLRRFELRAFCDKMRPSCTISGSTFWKIHPDIHTYIYTHTDTHHIHSHQSYTLFFISTTNFEAEVECS